MRARYTAALLLAFGLAACNADTNGPPITMPTAAQQAEIQSSLSAELGVTLGAMSMTGGGIGAGSWFAQGGMPNPFDCATFSGTADTDGDGVRDNVTLTFALPACRFAIDATTNVELTGGIRLVDPTPATADRSYQLTYQNLALAVLPANAAQALRFTYSGTRGLAVTPSTLTLTNDIGATFVRGTDPSAQFSHVLSVAFTANGGSPPITVGTTALPSGAITLTGAFQWHRDDAVFAMTVTTPTTLTYDATCALEPKITGGTVRAQLTQGSFYTITWTACGNGPSVTFTPVTT